MKLILWAVAEEIAFKAEAEVITEKRDIRIRGGIFYGGVDEEDDMAEEEGKTWDIDGPDPMLDWYSVLMARI